MSEINRESNGENDRSHEKKRSIPKAGEYWKSLMPKDATPKRWRDDVEHREDRVRPLEESINSTCDRLERYADLSQHFLGEVLAGEPERNLPASIVQPGHS